MTAHPIDTEAMRRLADAATPGPWEAEAANGGVFHVAVHPYPEGSVALDAKQADAEFIAAAREAIPALLDALAAAEHEREQAVGTALTAQQALDQMEHRATRAEAERDEWRQTALDERAAALDALEQLNLRDAQIKAAQHALTHRPKETP